MILLSSLLVWLSVINSPLTSQPEDWEEIRQKTVHQLENITRSAQGIVGLTVIDLTNGEQMGINQDLVFPQASAIKIPILMEVFRQTDQGKLSLDTLHLVKGSDQVGGSGVLGKLSGDTTQVSTRDLAILMILLSDNTATNMLIDLVGMENVNSLLRDLGMEQTRLQRKMMDIDARARGDENLSTPEEAAALMEALHKGEFVSRKICDEVLEILRLPKEGGLRSAVPDNVTVPFKAGGIPGVSTEWAIIELEKRPYVVVFMEKFALDDEAQDLIKDVSSILWNYFHRLAFSSQYGTYVQ